MAGQIIAKGEKRWLVRVFIGRDAGGKRQYVSELVQGGKKAAQDRLAEMLVSKTKGGLKVRPRETLDAYLDSWLETTAKPSVRARTLADYTAVLKRYVRPHLGASRLSKITAADVRGMIVALTEAEYSPRLVRMAHEVLRNALEQAVSDGLLPNNPARSRAVQKALPQKVRTPPKTLSAEDVANFLDVARGDRLYALWALQLMAGLRPGEALALRWSDVTGDTVSVVRTLVAPHKTEKREFLFEEPKTKGSRRAVIVPGLVVKALADHRKRQAEERLAAGPAWTDMGLIFCTETGGPLSQDKLRTPFRKLCAAAEVPGLTLYALRHSCATLLLEKGVPLKIVSERLGHSTIALTADTYSHVSESMQRQAATALEEMAR